MSLNLTIVGDFTLYQTSTKDTFYILDAYLSSSDNRTQDLEALSRYRSVITGYFEDVDFVSQHVSDLKDHLDELHSDGLYEVFSYI